MKSFAYTISRSTRRRSVSIVVEPDKRVRILAPHFLSEREIDRIAVSKRQWILAKISEFDSCELQRSEHQYETGELFLFLGSYLTLTVTDGRGRVFKDGSCLLAEVPPGLAGPDRRHYIRAKLLDFLQAEALQLTRKKTRKFSMCLGFGPEYVAIKNYTSRWGCCFSDGRIYYNWRLIMAPEKIIDYVVIHELCHLREANHSKKYWQLVESVIPDWRECRKWLRLNGHALDC